MVLKRILCALSLITTASCIMVPVPLPNIPSRAFSDDTLKSVQPGMTRADVLMTLGNPDRSTEGDRYFGYWWTVEKYAIVMSTIWGGGKTVVGFRPHMLMLEFDSDGKVKRMQELSEEDFPTLNREIDKWMAVPQTHSQ